MTDLAKKIETNRPVPNNPKLTTFFVSIVLREVMKWNRLEVLVLSQVQKPFMKRKSITNNPKSSNRSPLRAEREREVARTKRMFKKTNNLPRNNPPAKNLENRETKVPPLRKKKKMCKLKTSKTIGNVKKNFLKKRKKNFQISMYLMSAHEHFLQSLVSTSSQNGAATRSKSSSLQKLKSQRCLISFFLSQMM